MLVVKSTCGRTKGSLAPRLVAARSSGWVCWRPHLAGTRQYIDKTPISTNQDDHSMWPLKHFPFSFRYLRQLISHWCLGKDASLERFLTERDVSLINLTNGYKLSCFYLLIFTISQRTA